MTSTYMTFCKLRDFRDAGQEAPKYTEAEAFEQALLTLSPPPELPRVAQLRQLLHDLGGMLHDTMVGNQAAWIEWKRGAGAEAAMQWVHNGLAGPGHIPSEDEPYSSEPQAYFDAHRAEPFPKCACGRPSNILWMGQGFCCEAHHGQTQQDQIAAQQNGSQA